MDWQKLTEPIFMALALGIAGWIAKAFARVQKKVAEKVEAETAKIKNNTLRELADQAVQAAEQMSAAVLKATAKKWTSAEKLVTATDWLARRAELDPFVAHGLIEAAVHEMNNGLIRLGIA